MWTIGGDAGIVDATEQEVSTVRVNTGLVFWGVALITAGVVALAIQAGAIDAESAQELWRFWPVVIIVIGLAVIAARTPFALIATLVAGLVVGGMAGTLVPAFPDGFSFGCERRAGERLSEEGSFGGDAEVDARLQLRRAERDDRGGLRLVGRGAPRRRRAPEIESGGRLLRVAAEGGSVFGISEAASAGTSPSRPTPRSS